MNFNGARLKELRAARKWDQHRLAEEARKHSTGITQSQISRYENGQGEPTGRNALALASALGVDVRDLYSEGDGSDGDEEADPVSDLMAALQRVFVTREEVSRS